MRLYSSANPIAPFYEQGSLTPVFTDHARIDPRQLSYRECSRAIARMLDDMISVGMRTGHAMVDRRGQLYKFNEDGFEDELSILNLYAYELEFSSYFHDWVNERRKKLEIYFEYNCPASDLRQAWHHLDKPKERMGLIRDVLATHSRIYSHGAVPLPTPELALIENPMELRKGTWGFVVANSEDIDRGKVPAIELSPVLLSPGRFEDAFQVAHHEYIHWAITCLIAAMHRGEMGPDHPLYNDAMMEDEKFRAGAIINSAIYSAYRRQPEEDICYTQDELFRENILCAS